MAIESLKISTARGDSAHLTLMLLAGDPPSILIQIDDVDDTVCPTAEFTLKEAASLREALRQLCEHGQKAGKLWHQRTMFDIEEHGGV